MINYLCGKKQLPQSSLCGGGRSNSPKKLQVKKLYKVCSILVANIIRAKYYHIQESLQHEIKMLICVGAHTHIETQIHIHIHNQKQIQFGKLTANMQNNKTFIDIILLSSYMCDIIIPQYKYH